MNRDIKLHKTVSVLFILVGALVAVGGFQMFHPLQDETTYEVEKLTEEPNPSEIHQFENLSERGKEVFLKALETSDNTVVISEFVWENKKPPDITPRGEGKAIVIQYQDQNYVIRPDSDGAVLGTAFFLISISIAIPLVVGGWKVYQIPNKN